MTKSLVRNRSHSETGFFGGHGRTKSMGVMHRGLIGAEGTADRNTSLTSKSPVREAIVQKENSTRRLAAARLSKASSVLETRGTPSELGITAQAASVQLVRPSAETSKPSFHRAKTFNLEDAFSPTLGKPTVFGGLEVVTEKVTASYMQPTRASLAAQRRRREKESAQASTTVDEKVGARHQRRTSRNNEFASPLKRPTTATMLTTGCSSGGTSQLTMGSTQQSVGGATRTKADQRRPRRDSGAAANLSFNDSSAASANTALAKPQPRQTLLQL